MKLPKVVVLLLIVISIFTTGCETNTESPENLLNNNIIYDKNKNELYTFVNKSLDGTTLILPQNSSAHKKYSSRDQHEQDQHDYHTHNDRTFRIFLSSLTSLFLIHMLPLSRCSLFLWSDYSKSFPEPKELFFP